MRMHEVEEGYEREWFGKVWLVSLAMEETAAGSNA